MNPNVLKLLKIASKENSDKKMVNAMQIGVIIPEFSVVVFHTMEGLAIRGEGRYASTTEQDVQKDIDTAVAFAEFLAECFGIPMEADYSTKNNVLEITIHALCDSTEVSPEVAACIKRYFQFLIVEDL